MSEDIKKRVTEACFDIVSTIKEKNLPADIYNMYPITVRTGKLASILNILRVKSNKLKTITKDTLLIHLRYLGLTTYGIDKDIDFLKELKVIKETDDDEFKILIMDIKEVYNICFSYFAKHVTENKNTDDFKIVYTLVHLITPQTVSILIKKFSEPEGIEDMCNLLKQLGLVGFIEKEKMYYSVKYFGENKEKICDLLSTNKNISEDVMKIIYKVHDIPGIPMDEFAMLSLKQFETIKANALLGIFDMVNVQAGQLSKRFLFDPNVKKDNKLSLAKETTAYFRFNQIFADKNLGRLDQILIPTLKKLSREGIAGSADNIATNYKPIEAKGVFKVEQRGLYNRPCMVLQKKDIIDDTISLIQGDYNYSKPISFKRSIKDLIKNPTESRANLSILDQIFKKNKDNLINTIRDGGMR